MLDIIIYYLNIINSDKKIDNRFTVHQGSAKYLLGQTVIKNIPNKIEISLCKGASKTPTEVKIINEGHKFIFKDVFLSHKSFTLRLISPFINRCCTYIINTKSIANSITFVMFYSFLFKFN